MKLLINVLNVNNSQNSESAGLLSTYINTQTPGDIYSYTKHDPRNHKLDKLYRLSLLRNQYYTRTSHNSPNNLY